MTENAKKQDRPRTKRTKLHQPFNHWWNRYAKRYPDDAGRSAYLSAREAWKAATRRAKK